MELWAGGQASMLAVLGLRTLGGWVGRWRPGAGFRSCPGAWNAVETGPGAMLRQLDVARAKVILETSFAKLLSTGGAGEVLARLAAPPALPLAP